MRDRYDGLFVAEGTSDAPLARIVESLFADHGVALELTGPDLSVLEHVGRDVRAKVSRALELRRGQPTDLIVVHRDADNAGRPARQTEIFAGVDGLHPTAAVIPLIPVRMTEAWLLLDERAIRQVAGEPNRKVPLYLPTAREAERKADPKQILKDCLLRAADATGRQHTHAARRFNGQRRQLLEGLDVNGPVTRLASWQALVADVARVAGTWR